MYALYSLEAGCCGTFATTGASSATDAYSSHAWCPSSFFFLRSCFKTARNGIWHFQLHFLYIATYSVEHCMVLSSRHQASFFSPRTLSSVSNYPPIWFRRPNDHLGETGCKTKATISSANAVAIQRISSIGAPDSVEQRLQRRGCCL